MHSTPKNPLPAIAWVYLGLALIGAVSTWGFNLAAFEEIGDGFTPMAFMKVGFEGSSMLGSLAADFWVGATTSILWIFVEGRRLKMRRLWLYFLLTFVVAWAFALPLFLFMRERRLLTLAQQAGQGTQEGEAAKPPPLSGT